ncbi:S-layer homology domain-containing protein [Paenibacillus aceti]|uniref:SLH domain-containing protein n=1 Tax=Paenibacillus aceti TaxID=1820010 RepID=A0ABQ1VT25_9BACL|nr:S-layer homology domain-containing protein [Paenibacillus aceti]GGF96478.1 hypothetical protein GCM10010913_17650 [Paenibacillus aceti]
MTIRKKVVVSTLAVSMIAATLSGIPLSSKAYGSHVGAIVASAAAADSNFDKVKEKLDALKKGIETQENGKEKLSNLKDEISKISDADLKEAFDSILAKTKAAGVDDEVLLNLYKDISSLTYDPEYQDLEKIRNNKDYIDAAKKLAKAGGVKDLTVDDIVKFVFDLQNDLNTSLKGKSEIQLVALLQDKVERDKLLDEALSKNVKGNHTLEDVIKELGITRKDIKDTVDNVRGKLNNETVKMAALTLIGAYRQAFLTDSGTGGNNGPGGGGSGAASGGGAPVTKPSTEDTAESLSQMDVSKLVKIVDGKATLELNEADVLKKLDKIKSLANGKTDLALTLNLGTVDAAAISVPLSKNIVEAAKAAGIANVNVVVNGITVTLPLSQFADSLNLIITKQEDSAVTSISQLKLASDVLKFELEVNGVIKNEFRSPITIRLPLRDATVDRELLTVAKVEESSLKFEGGTLDGQHIVEPRGTLATFAVVENKVTFNDISSVQAWAGRQIQVVAAKGAIEGRGNGVFAPKDSVTRAEFSKMLILALNMENSFDTATFTDVSSDAWYAPYVATAARLGIIQGRSADKFAPNDKITRAEMATMISRALKVSQQLGDVENVDGALTQFGDADKIAASLKSGVAFAASNNLVIGSGGKFNPNNQATRAEAAVMIYRTMNFENK